MGTYTPEDLLLAWKQDTVTHEQAIGHLIQHLVAANRPEEKARVKHQINEALAEIRDRLTALQDRIALIEQHLGGGGKPSVKRKT